MVIPIPVNSQQRGLLLAWCFTEPLCVQWEDTFCQLSEHMSLPVLSPFDPGAVNTIFQRFGS